MTRALSPGVAFGCIELLGALTREVLTASEAKSLTLGSVSSADIVSAAFGLGWIETANDGSIAITVKGARVVSTSDTPKRLRSLVLDHIDATGPPWIQLAPHGRREVLLQAPRGITQIFVEAGLAYGADSETVSFWDALAARARGVRSATLSEIGRTGERLSIEFERRRTGQEPKWVALESNADGYDLLSRLSMDDPRRLTIEVKTSAQGLNGLLHVTRNEWNLAIESLNHIFHLWDVRSDPPRLAMLDVEAFANHVPRDQGYGEWQSATIPFLVFEAKFTPLRI